MTKLTKLLPLMTDEIEAQTIAQARWLSAVMDRADATARVVIRRNPRSGMWLAAVPDDIPRAFYTFESVMRSLNHDVTIPLCPTTPSNPWWKRWLM